MTDPDTLKRGRDDDDDPDHAPKYPRTDDSASSDSSSDDSSSDDDGDEVQRWVDQCREYNYTAQETYDSVVGQFGQEVADNHAALHDIRQIVAGAPSDSSESGSDSDSDGEPQPVSVQDWVNQCYDLNYSQQEIYDSVVENYGQEVADNDIALHNIRLMLAMHAQPANDDNADNDPDASAHEGDNLGLDQMPLMWAASDGQPQDGQQGPELEVLDYEDWQQLAAQDGQTVFANAVADPFADFEDANADFPNDLCALCQEQLAPDVVRSTRCRHCFHRACITDMTANPTVWQCPTCRESWA